MQQNILKSEENVRTSSVTFSEIYKDKLLGIEFDRLENLYDVIDKVSTFSSLVNPSISKNQPYHRWARYREAYAGDIVKEIIKSIDINPEKDFILDPMCGSGSTNVACKELGIDSLGLDVNGYSVLLSSAKLANYTRNDIRLIEKQLHSYKPLNSTRKNKSNLTSVSSSKFSEVEKYFETANLRSLEEINDWIVAIDKKKIREFFKVAWIAILEDCSERKKDGNGLATRSSNISNVLEHFNKQVLCMIEDIKENPLPNKVNAKAYAKSALDLRKASQPFLKKKDMGAIIYSPPYANSFDYFESYKIELIMGGFFKFSELKGARKCLIRNYRLNKGETVSNEFDLVDGLCKEIWESIPEKESDTGVRDGRTRLVPNMLKCYFDDMWKVLYEGFYALRNKGTMNIVVDQSSYLGVPIPTDLILAKIGEDIGYKVKTIIKCRRAGTSGQQLKKFPYLKEMLRESIVVLEKT